MSQTAYSTSLVKGLHGSKADSRVDFVESMQAYGTIPIGRGVSKVYGNDTQVLLPVTNNVVITDDAGTFTAGVVTVTINGTAVGSGTYTSNKDTTLTALAAAIQAAAPAGVYSAVYASGAHTITIKSSNQSLTVTIDVSGITGNMTAAVAASSINTFAGVALNSGTLDQGLPGGSGAVEYTVGMGVSVLRAGAVYVIPEEVVTSDDSVYFRIVTNGAKLPGMFGKSADSGKCIIVSNARWVEGGTTTTVAKLEFNLP